jgi:hypothetical protein
MTHDPTYSGARWDGEARTGHTESWFLKANDPSGERAVWLKWTLFQSAPSRAIAEVWAVAFTRGAAHMAVKSSAPATTARFARDGLDVSIDGARLTPSAARGSVSSGGRSVSFDLALDARGGPYVSYRDAWMRGRFPAQKAASPLVDARISGTVRVDDAAWSLEGWHGMVGHNWGPRHNASYAWVHCNTWNEDVDLVVECVSGRPTIGPLVAPLTTIGWARLGGVAYPMNTPWSILRNRATVSTHRYTILAHGDGATLEGEVVGLPENTVGLYYPNPGAPPTHCLNTKLARASFELRTKAGTTVRATSHSAALEVGTLDPTHGLRMYL